MKPSVKIGLLFVGLNGPKGDLTKECLIVVKMRKGRKAIVQGRGKDCAARVGRAVDRELGRSRKDTLS